MFGGWVGGLVLFLGLSEGAFGSNRFAALGFEFFAGIGDPIFRRILCRVERCRGGRFVGFCILVALFGGLGVVGGKL